MINHHPMTREILRHFPYEPTSDQQELIGRLVDFIQDAHAESLFIIKGYAGTGKTTLVSSLVKTLERLGNKPVLLAPTGRAAKVLATYSGEKAYTIHKKIYRLNTNNEGYGEATLMPNKHKNTLFLVDEASMIPARPQQDQGNLFDSVNLLDDLIQYIYSGEHCRLVLIGDTAQLPPVHASDSPALNAAYLSSRFRLRVEEFEIKQVVRQELKSGILYNATLLRNMLLKKQSGFPVFQTREFRDFVRLQHDDAAEYITEAFDQRKLQESLIVCRSNKRARLYNEQIRRRVLYMDGELNSGDLLMVVRNNYFWLPDDSDAGFIANGDMIQIKRIIRMEEAYGMRFADIQASLTDYPDEPDLEVKIMLDTLSNDAATLEPFKYKNLSEAVSEEYAGIKNNTSRLAAIKENHYLQSLQVKFAYALTCHKSQGGQWKNVFVDMAYFSDTLPGEEYIRWLYTALTRATEKVYLMNFTEQFFGSANQT